MADPCQRIQNQVDEVGTEIQDLLDALPDVPVRLRPTLLRQLAVLRRQLRNLTALLHSCQVNPAPFILQLDEIEVTQAIQDPGESVPLVAGKTTVARVYLSYYQSPAITVRGTLLAQRPGGSPVSVSSIADVVLDPALAGNTTSKRKNAALSLNFVLPGTEVDAGQLSVSLGTLVNAANGTSLHVAYNTATSVSFEAAHPLRVRVLAVRYTAPPPAQPAVVAPRPTDLQHLRSWLGRAYPVAQVIWSTATIDSNKPAPFGSGDVNAQIAAIRAQDVAGGVDHRTHYYGMVSDAGFFMRGSAAGIPSTPDPSTVASGPTGPATWGWDFDGSYGDWYGGHELGHTFGRFHPGSGCGESSDDPSYPYTHGQLADSDSSYVGFDTGDPALGIAMAAYPGTAWHDVMTYCSFQWLSDYTYRGIKSRLEAEDALPAGPVPVLVPVAVASAGGRPDERFPKVPTAERDGGGQALLSVVATVNLTTRGGKIEFVNPLAAGQPSPSEPGTQVLIRSLRADGTVLSEHPVEVKINSELGPGDERTGLVDAAIPIEPEARSLELVVAGQTADTFRAAGQPPPASASGRVTVEPDALHVSWEPGAGADPRHTYTVQTSTDGGRTWYTLAIGLAEPRIRLDRAQFDTGQEVRVRVLATDGFTSSTIMSETVTG